MPPSLEAWNHTLKRVVHVRYTAGFARVSVFEMALARSVQKLLKERRRQLLVWHSKVGAVVLRQLIEHLPVISHGIHRRENLPECTIDNALLWVCYYRIVRYSKREAEPSAVLAGAVRAVERECPRLHLIDSDSVLRTREESTVRLNSVILDEINITDSLAFLDCSLNSLCKTAPVVASYRDSIDHNLNRVPDILLKLRHLLVDSNHLAVNPGPGVSVPSDSVENIPVLTLPALDNRREHHNLLTLSILDN